MNIPRNPYEDSNRAICMVIIAVALAIVLAIITTACGTVSIEVNPETGAFSMETRTFLKNIEAGEIQTDEIIGSVGSSTTDQNAESALMLVCVINPAAPMCQKDP